MLREDGVAYDDGTTARLGENHFIMTTTTANAALVFRNLELSAVSQEDLGEMEREIGKSARCIQYSLGLRGCRGKSKIA